MESRRRQRTETAGGEGSVAGRPPSSRGGWRRWAKKSRRVRGSTSSACARGSSGRACSPSTLLPRSGGAQRSASPNRSCSAPSRTSRRWYAMRSRIDDEMGRRRQAPAVAERERRRVVFQRVRPPCPGDGSDGDGDGAADGEGGGGGGGRRRVASDCRLARRAHFSTPCGRHRQDDRTRREGRAGGIAEYVRHCQSNATARAPVFTTTGRSRWDPPVSAAAVLRDGLETILGGTPAASSMSS